MTYRGRVEKGIVVLEPGAQLREGTEVRVEPIQDSGGGNGNSADLDNLRAGLMRFSGIVKGGPSDIARNHDHYLHGTPRK